MGYEIVVRNRAGTLITITNENMEIEDILKQVKELYESDHEIIKIKKQPSYILKNVLPIQVKEMQSGYNG